MGLVYRWYVDVVFKPACKCGVRVKETNMNSIKRYIIILILVGTLLFYEEYATALLLTGIWYLYEDMVDNYRLLPVRFDNGGLVQENFFK